VLIDQKDIKARCRQLCNEAFRYAVDYHRVNHSAPGLRLISARYGQAFRAIGMTLRDGLESDGRFKLSIIPGRGSYQVEVSGASPVEVLVLGIIKDGPKATDVVMQHVLSEGFTDTDFYEAFDSMIQNSRITAFEGKYALPEHAPKVVANDAPLDSDLARLDAVLKALKASGKVITHDSKKNQWARMFTEPWPSEYDLVL
jgi:hypothetical protein